VSWRQSVEQFWTGPAGGREVALVAYPLILGHLSFTIQTFINRLFLTWYSAEAVAGAVTGLFAVWSLIALFTGTGEFLTTFIAQYFGAGRLERIGAAVWQGIYFSIGAGACIALLSPLAGPAFDLARHEPLLRRYEVEYAHALMLGSFPVILMATLSTFFAGRGETRVILYVNVLATLVNVALDYVLIFGKAGFPELGVTGAALGTVVSQVAGAAVYLTLILGRANREKYGTLVSYRLEPWLVARLVRFGMPTGLQYALEVSAFAVFMVIVGRIGTQELAASGIARPTSGPREVTRITLVSGTRTGRLVSMCGQIGVSSTAGSAGCRIGPPAARLYAVEPVGEETIRPSARNVDTNSPSIETCSSMMRESAAFVITTSLSTCCCTSGLPGRFTVACSRRRSSKRMLPASKPSSAG